MKNNPFGDLRKQLGLPDPGTSEPRDSGTPGLRDFEPGDFDRSGPKRAVVRYERSGRGGKEVTVIEQLGLRDAELQIWVKQLKAALGCGGSVESDAIMLQGDHRKRLPALLTTRGVRKVTVP
ncbi:MAG: translation initiation factor [Acidimicrobiia bacterium]|nr:translation initiation factor [Acidimicrobiia bacterium]